MYLAVLLLLLSLVPSVLSYQRIILHFFPLGLHNSVTELDVNKMVVECCYQRDVTRRWHGIHQALLDHTPLPNEVT